jgi:hypothetical protein
MHHSMSVGHRPDVIPCIVPAITTKATCEMTRRRLGRLSSSTEHPSRPSNPSASRRSRGTRYVGSLASERQETDSSGSVQRAPESDTIRLALDEFGQPKEVVPVYARAASACMRRACEMLRLRRDRRDCSGLLQCIHMPLCGRVPAQPCRAAIEWIYAKIQHCRAAGRHVESLAEDRAVAPDVD